jgi:hypothetical protein
MKNKIGFAMSLALVTIPAVVLWCDVAARANDGSIRVNGLLMAFGTVFFVIGLAGACASAANCKCEE